MVTTALQATDLKSSARKNASPPRSRREHKTARGFQKIPISICEEPGCEFNGDRASQGICYSKLPAAHDKYVSHVLGSGEELLKELRGLRKVNKQTSKDAWIKALEGQLVCTWANSQFGLDELVHLRAENARLRLALGRLAKFERGDWTKDRITLRRKATVRPKSAHHTKRGGR